MRLLMKAEKVAFSETPACRVRSSDSRWASRCSGFRVPDGSSGPAPCSVEYRQGEEATFEQRPDGLHRAYELADASLIGSGAARAPAPGDGRGRAPG